MYILYIYECKWAVLVLLLVTVVIGKQKSIILEYFYFLYRHLLSLSSSLILVLLPIFSWFRSWKCWWSEPILMTRISNRNRQFSVRVFSHTRMVCFLRDIFLNMSIISVDWKIKRAVSDTPFSKLNIRGAQTLFLPWI